MKKTILGVVFMSTIIALCLTFAVGATNTTSMSISDAMVDKMKEYEGFVRYPVHDHTQYSVGYGSKCNPGDYPNGITEAEAEVLFRQYLETFESAINNYITKRGIVLTQGQYDVLVSMNYNIGPIFLNDSYRIWTYLMSGNYTDVDMYDAIAAWRNAGGAVSPGLVKRRANEAQIFFFDEYSRENLIVNTTFVTNGGTLGQTVRLDCKTHTYDPLPEPTRAGYHFTGWFTAPSGGTKVTEATLVTGNATLYAQWSNEVVSQTEPEDGFSDVAKDAWYYDYVRMAVELGAVTGYTDNTYRPEQPVACGEVMKSMMVLAGYPVQKPLGTGHWADGYEAVALASGLLQHVEYTSLDDAITREDVATFAINLLEVSVTDTDRVFVDTDSQFTNAAYEHGIFNGSVGKDGNRYFYPDDNITRAEFSKVLVALDNAIFQ